MSAEQEISGYIQNINYTWSEINNHLTTSLSDNKPDIFESYNKTNYPLEAVDVLSSILVPIVYNITIPAYTIKFKGSDRSIAETQLQYAYNGVFITEGARIMHIYRKIR
jgi:hypothetical protein